MGNIKIKTTRDIKTVWISGRLHKYLRRKAFESEGKESITSLINKAVMKTYGLDANGNPKNGK